MTDFTKDEKDTLIGLVNNQLVGYRRSEEHFGVLSRINRGEDRKRYRKLQLDAQSAVEATELLLDKIKELEVHNVNRTIR